MRKINIVLSDNPTDGDNFIIRVQSPSNFYNNLSQSIFKNSVTLDTHVLIGATLSDTIDNLYNARVAYFSALTFVTVVKNVDGIDILVDDTSATSSTNSITGDIVITHSDITIDTFTRDNIILSRSPFDLSLTPSISFDSISLNLYLYRGIQTTDAPITQTYPLSKSVIQAGQSTINFEISKYLNDYCKSNIPTFVNGVNTSTSYDSVWCDAELIVYYLDEEVGTTTRQYLAIDGFGWHTELYNPKLTTNVLSSITSHIVYRGSDYPIYFVTKDLISITADGDSIAFTLDPTINNQAIAYINLKDYYTYLTNFNIVFEYADSTETHSIIVKDECRFHIYNCFFKNKYGFWQSIPFNLRSKTTLNVESSEYSPIVSTYGQYSLKSHNTKTYLPTSKEVITVNTDFLPEEYNALIDELFESEFVYLENNGEYLPVNLNKNSIDKKTKKFDKLIQYTLDFKYSFNKRNTVN
jgi:hypothetical protein